MIKMHQTVSIDKIIKSYFLWENNEESLNIFLLLKAYTDRLFCLLSVLQKHLNYRKWLLNIQQINKKQCSRVNIKIIVHSKWKFCHHFPTLRHCIPIILFSLKEMYEGQWLRLSCFKNHVKCRKYCSESSEDVHKCCHSSHDVNICALNKIGCYECSWLMFGLLLLTYNQKRPSTRLLMSGCERLSSYWQLLTECCWSHRWVLRTERSNLSEGVS